MLNLVVQLETCGSYSSQLQLKALSLCEGCHYQRSWHVELRFGRPESHLRWALKTADFGKGEVSFLGTGQSLQIWGKLANLMMWANGNVSDSMSNMVRSLTLVRILERISRTWGVCWPFLLKTWSHGSRLKDRSCPVNDQLPHGMATFIEKLFESCQHGHGWNRGFGKGFLPIPFCVAISRSRDGNPHPH